MDKNMQVQEVSNTHNNNTSSIHEHHQHNNGPLPTTTKSGDGDLHVKDGSPFWKRQKISSGDKNTDNNNGANNGGTMFNHDLYRYYPQHNFLDTLPNPAIYDNTSSLLQYFPQHATTGIDGTTTTTTSAIPEAVPANGTTAARGVSNPLSEQTGGDFPPSEHTQHQQQQIPTYGSPAAANNHPYPAANGVTTLTATTEAQPPPVPKDLGDDKNVNSNVIKNSGDNNGSENSQSNNSNGNNNNNNNNNTHNSNGGIPYQQIQHPNVAAMAASILMYQQQQHASSQVQKQHQQHQHNVHLGMSDPTQLAQHIAQIHPYYHINQQQQQQQQQSQQPPQSQMTPQQQEQQKQQAKENAAAVASAAAAIVARSKSATNSHHPTNPPLTISNWPQPNVTMPLSYLSSLGSHVPTVDSANNSVSDDKDPNNNPYSHSTDGKTSHADNEDRNNKSSSSNNDQAAMSDTELKKQKAREKNRIHSRNSRMRKKDSIIRLKQDNSHLQMYRIITEAMADMVSLHDLSDEARIIYANPSFIAKFAVPPIMIPPTPNTTPFQQVVNPPPTPHRRVPSCFLQLVHEEDVKALVDCLRLVRLDATQAPILSLRMLVSASPPAADGSLLYSMVQTRIQACAAVGTLLIVTRPLGSDGDYFRYLPSSVSAVTFNNVSPVASTGFVL